ncbi:LADA_0E14642g1_1 [Lachancea dasiensis]|uniref:LADA_0E14642g1_1 n=1 Tax=Lachancea dasiensis TaxID=1072105 RepID=A0A1G4JG49_9SACH|nr:LADA_0E14642g1_1 [Lachancea dasiensis]
MTEKNESHSVQIGDSKDVQHVTPLTEASRIEAGSIVDVQDAQANGYLIDADGNLRLKNGLKPGLKNRMINLMTICGILGPGTFVGMGSMLKSGGGAGMLAGFAIVAILVISMMFSVGEINATLDFNFCVHASRYVSPGFGGSMALAYVVMWITNLIAEYTSLSSICTNYTTKVPFYGWYLIFWGFFTAFQFLGVTAYGEAEYILGFVKLIFIGGFYLFAIIYASGGVPGHKTGNPFGEVPLVGGFRGIANSFVFAGIFLSGIESVSVFASEARNPRKAIPVAVRNTMFRIFFVYFGLSIFYAITVSPQDPALHGDNLALRAPMTIALTNAGWYHAKYFVTTIVLLTCVSSINSAIFLASRSLFTWADMGMGPKVFKKTDKKGVPWVSVHTCHLFSFLCLLSISNGSAVAYSYIVNVTGVAAFIIWTGISFTHFRFRKGWIHQGKSLEDLGFSAPLYPWSNVVAICLGIVLILVQGWSSFDPWDYSTFIDAYILLPVFMIVWAAYDFVFLKTRIVRYADMDFETGKRIDVDDAVRKSQLMDLTSALSH